MSRLAQDSRSRAEKQNACPQAAPATPRDNKGHAIGV